MVVARDQYQTADIFPIDNRMKNEIVRPSLGSTGVNFGRNILMREKVSSLRPKKNCYVSAEPPGWDFLFRSFGRTNILTFHFSIIFLEILNAECNPLISHSLCTELVIINILPGWLVSLFLEGITLRLVIKSHSHFICSP